MATVRLFQRFETTVGGVTYTGGSLTSPSSVSAAATSAAEGVFDTSVLVGTTATKVFDSARDLGLSAGFDFMWIEVTGTSGTSYTNLQLTAGASTDDQHFVKRLANNERWVFMSNEARAATTIDLVTGAATAATIDEIWAGTTGGTARLRVFAVT